MLATRDDILDDTHGEHVHGGRHTVVICDATCRNLGSSYTTCGLPPQEKPRASPLITRPPLRVRRSHVPRLSSASIAACVCVRRGRGVRREEA